jgi:hypothetical protein
MYLLDKMTNVGMSLVEEKECLGLSSSEAVLDPPVLTFNLEAKHNW